MIALCHRIADRARWELKEWRTPSRASFLHEELDRALLDKVRWLTGERVLDVGCAHGEYMAALIRRGARLTGIDVAVELLGKARATGGAVAAAAGDALPFADASFDTILCHKTLYLIESPQRLIGEFRRVLRPGGRVVFSGSNTRSPYGRAQALAIRMARGVNGAAANDLSIKDWISAFAKHDMPMRTVYSCNLIWPLVFRLCDRWIIPNEWMRRYNRWIRRTSGMPIETRRPSGLAQDYVVEVIRPA